MKQTICACTVLDNILKMPVDVPRKLDLKHATYESYVENVKRIIDDRAWCWQKGFYLEFNNNFSVLTKRLFTDLTVTKPNNQ